MSLGVRFYLTPFYLHKVATKSQLLRYSGMIQQMIQSMLGEYSKFITLLPNGQVRLSIPKDIKDVNSEIIDSIDLSMQGAMNLYDFVRQPKQYISDGKILKEGDAEFDINKWLQLAINEFKNK